MGIARASMRARLPEPLKTVKTEEAIEQLRKIIKENEIKIIVAGLPRNLSGEDTGQTRWVKDWVAQAKAELGVAFYWQDEALTSHEAMAKVQRSKFKDQSNYVDAQAAAIILEDFLSTDINNRVLV